MLLDLAAGLALAVLTLFGGRIRYRHSSFVGAEHLFGRLTVTIQTLLLEGRSSTWSRQARLVLQTCSISGEILGTPPRGRRRSCLYPVPVDRVCSSEAAHVGQ
jgi:hypothetical protein